MKKRPPRTESPLFHYVDSLFGRLTGSGTRVRNRSSKPILEAHESNIPALDPTSLPQWLERWEAERIEDRRRRYLETGNPLYVWQAYRTCRELETDVPEWALVYLDHVAVSLLEPTAKKKDPKFVARALDLDVGRGDSSAFRDIEQDQQGPTKYGQAVISHLRTHGGQETYAIAEVAKQEGVSESTVRRSLESWLESIELPPAEWRRSFKK